MRIPFISRLRAHRDLRDTALTVIAQSNSQLHEDLKTLRGQVEELVKLNRRRELLVIAAHAFADRFDDEWLASELADRMSDADLETLLDLFHAAGRSEAIEMWKSHHTTDQTGPESSEDQGQGPAHAQVPVVSAL
ncbi:hypothetical protein AB0L74_10180 [Streptomyces sp. NPDC052020]|uniref:hypothetical protein n=1 Tax=Streptomyces sp. NPDC052020 TaxID=3155677 RepID=UPI00342CA055